MGRVVERAQHAGHVAQGQVGVAALADRAQRLALEVEQDPAAVGRVEHLPEVVVAVDPLQHREVRQLVQLVVDGVDRLLDAGQVLDLAAGPGGPDPQRVHQLGPAGR